MGILGGLALSSFLWRLAGLVPGQGTAMPLSLAGFLSVFRDADMAF